MFSKTCEYAIRALIFIARKSKLGEKAGIKEISAGIDAPEKFIAKILHELSKKDMVLSMKGPAGGFYLDKKGLKYTLADIVKAVDGDDIFSGCGLGLNQCSEEKPCPIHYQYKKIRKEMYSMLQKAKLGEMPDQIDNKISYLKHR